jgi:hypothetical protein
MALPITHAVIRATRTARVIDTSGPLGQLFFRSDKRTVFDLGQIQDRWAPTIVGAEYWLSKRVRREDGRFAKSDRLSG